MDQSKQQRDAQRASRGNPAWLDRGIKIPRKKILHDRANSRANIASETLSDHTVVTRNACTACCSCGLRRKEVIKYPAADLHPFGQRQKDTGDDKSGQDRVARSITQSKASDQLSFFPLQKRYEKNQHGRFRMTILSPALTSGGVPSIFSIPAASDNPKKQTTEQEKQSAKENLDPPGPANQKQRRGKQ